MFSEQLHFWHISLMNYGSCVILQYIGSEITYDTELHESISKFVHKSWAILFDKIHIVDLESNLYPYNSSIPKNINVFTWLIIYLYYKVVITTVIQYTSYKSYMYVRIEFLDQNFRYCRNMHI